VRPEIIYVLRRDVLRPGQPLSAVMHDYDFQTDTFHVAAFGPRNQVAACATFYPEPPPGKTEDHAWRLRAMASLPQLRGRGYGAAALRYGITEIRRRGGALLWCNARTGAVGFYERIGFSIVSDEFEVESIGPHFVMQIQL
jgi:GNAT superfamily N-acetyltransferase